MTLSNRIELLSLLGRHLLKFEDRLEQTILQTYYQNRWFTQENTRKSIEAIARQFLDKEKLIQWTNAYQIKEEVVAKRVGLVMAGNIPLVGFHDWLAVFITGHSSKIKLSDKDKLLLPYFIDFLVDLEPQLKDYFEVCDFLKEFEMVIATGSDNSARYFEAYFGKYPHIIRRNRTSVAILNGKESKEELLALGDDLFSYFGLGCRNVSKIYVPEGYDFNFLMETLHEFKEIVLHDKYKNNFDYNFSLLILNRIKHYSNGCVLMHEAESLHSRIASLHFEYYQSEDDLMAKITDKQEEIQCIVSNSKIGAHSVTPFGEAQHPGLFDYADGVDTVSFLLENS